MSPIKGQESVSTAISDHPDIYYCKLGCHDDAPVFCGDPGMLNIGYPEEIIYNAACTGRYIIHNMKYTCPELLNTARSMGMIPVDVKQGYAKCNTVIVSENAVISSDRGMCSAMQNAGLDVLLIDRGHISLQGYEYGFIGGASGRIKNEIIFNGDLSAHPDFKRICDFIKYHALEIKYFEEFPLSDIGSIISMC